MKKVLTIVVIMILVLCSVACGKTADYKTIKGEYVGVLGTDGKDFKDISAWSLLVKSDGKFVIEDLNINAKLVIDEEKSSEDEIIYHFDSSEFSEKTTVTLKRDLEDSSKDLIYLRTDDYFFQFKRK